MTMKFVFFYFSRKLGSYGMNWPHNTVRCREIQCEQEFLDYDHVCLMRFIFSLFRRWPSTNSAVQNVQYNFTYNNL